MSDGQDTQKKPWGGRFSLPTDEFVEAFTESVSLDHRLCQVDVQASIAHARMLASIKVLGDGDAERIEAALKAILQDVEAGRIQWSTRLEDVHMNIESELVHRIGELGKKLHTARSRNDQVATDMRLYLRDESVQIRELLEALMHVLLDLAMEYNDACMPGFTHLQIAQPVTFGHHMLAWCEMLLRDRERLAECRERMNILPLGAVALAGTGFPIDREQVARELGFRDVAHNSLDAVSDRDFLIEFSSCSSLLMMHLSRFSEELILWMSTPFAFIEPSDAWSTGSSVMPQKRNPDIPELVRGKTARVYGHLMGMLSLMKAQPLSYNRDNQEDKGFLFDTVDTVKQCLRAFIGMLPTCTVNVQRMHDMADQGYSTATDLADYLVRKDIPFRDAHETTGRIVDYAIGKQLALAALSLEELKTFEQRIDADVYSVLSVSGSLSARCHTGGTAPVQVRKEIARLRGLLAE